jgi:predicted transcriptional regulator of viral defense system
MACNSASGQSQRRPFRWNSAESLRDHDHNPSVIDVTVPKATRLRRDVPMAVRIHQRDYGAEDVTRVHGLPATALFPLFRTLVDLIEAGRDLQFVDEALTNASSRAALTSKEIISALQSFHALDPRIVSILTGVRSTISRQSNPPKRRNLR